MIPTNEEIDRQIDAHDAAFDRELLSHLGCSPPAQGAIYAAVDAPSPENFHLRLIQEIRNIRADRKHWRRQSRRFEFCWGLLQEAYWFGWPLSPPDVLRAILQGKIPDAWRAKLDAETIAKLEALSTT